MQCPAWRLQGGTLLSPLQTLSLAALEHSVIEEEAAGGRRVAVSLCSSAVTLTTVIHHPTSLKDVRFHLSTR